MDIFSLSDNDMAHGNYPYLIDTPHRASLTHSARELLIYRI